MKKYLMTGIAALAMCFGFTSCSHDIEPASQEDLNNLEAEQIVNAYNQAFIKTFGQPAANQTWGFGTSATRTANTNSNEWFKPIDQQGYGLQKPDDLFDEEIEYVMDWFSQVRQGHGETLDLKNYFVQQVAYGDKNDQGVSHTPSGQVWEKFENGQHVYRTETYSVNSKNQMDWIASNMKANVQSESDCDHINNFNTGSGSLMYMQNSETKYGFSFKDSWGTVDNLVSTNYYMVHLVADYKGKHIDGWYVGFDYQTLKTKTETKTYSVSLDHDPWYENVSEEIVTENVRLDPDGIYNDRVVKIVPAGEIINNDYDVRIIAEDLNATAQDGDLENSDWDFNDVVFDVKFTSDNDAEITLVAAGGTLPLIVGVEKPTDNTDYPANEVHAKFGVAVNYMVNTNAEAKHLNGGAPVNPSPKLTFSKTGVKASNGNLIPIHVQKTLKDGTKKWFELTAKQGHPAAKLAVNSKSKKFSYCDERQDITKKYPSFLDWVVNNDPIIWW